MCLGSCEREALVLWHSASGGMLYDWLTCDILMPSSSSIANAMWIDQARQWCRTAGALDAACRQQQSGGARPAGVRWTQRRS